MDRIILRINNLKKTVKKSFFGKKLTGVKYSIYKKLNKTPALETYSKNIWLKLITYTTRIATLFFVLLRFYNVSLDFPYYITITGAPLTDEGWYFSGVINKLTWGQWYLPGDFNPIVSLPLNNFIAYPILNLFDHPLIPLRVFTCILAIITLLFVRKLARRFLSQITVDLFLLFLSIDFLFFSYSRIALLEVWVLSLCAISSYFVLNPDKKRQSLQLFIGSFALLVALILKPQSFPLTIALLYALLKNPERKTRKLTSVIIVLTPILVYISTFQILKIQFPEDHFLFYSINLKERLITDFWRILINIPFLLINTHFSITPFILPGIIGLLLGTILPLGKKQRFLSRFFLLWFSAQFSLYCLFNYQPERYLLFLILPIYVGLSITIVTLLKLKGKLKIPGIAFAILMIIFQFKTSTSKIQKYFKTAEPSYVHFMQSVETILKNRHKDIKDARVIGAFAHTVSLYAKFRAINTDLTTIPIDRKIKQYQPQYLICFENEKWDFDKFTNRYRLKLLLTEPVMKNYYRSLPLSLYELDPTE
ncbi:ArnT family glycosyltransferase [Leptospira wolffii]|uniref:ArnT family glycosyltransferase n=1 Tax=Leptospira wolffii TaxID=409998 RepID=A0ABV5BKR7_9LEPT